ncbi:MAG: macro domain-containing protein [Verrucomicrobiales bacterium]
MNPKTLERVEFAVGDIVEQADLAAIVNAANAQLRIGGGVAGAIHSKGDPELENETRPLAPIRPGQAVLTSAPNLPNEHVIHCLGPRYGIDRPEAELLADCYRNALRIAAEHEIESVGFPALSTGAFGYPPEEAVHVAVDAVLEALDRSEYPKKVRFVLYDRQAYELYARALAEEG